MTNKMKSRVGYLFLPHPEARWIIVYAVRPEPDYDTLTSGSVVEVKIGNKWIRTSIEHGGRGYYATTQGIQLTNKMKARRL